MNSSTSVGLRGDSFIELDREIFTHFDPSLTETMDFTISTDTLNGLLFWQTGTAEGRKNDYLGLASESLS